MAVESFTIDDQADRPEEGGVEVTRYFYKGIQAVEEKVVFPGALTNMQVV